MSGRLALAVALLAVGATGAVAGSPSRARSPVPPRPLPASPVTASADLALPETHVTVAFPAAAGWTLDQSDAQDVLVSGGSVVRVSAVPRACAAWASDGPAAALPAWAPASAWPVAHPIAGAEYGRALCFQAADTAYVIAMRTLAAPAPDADTLAVVLAVADAVRPPVVIVPELPAVRVPLPLAPHGDHTWTAFDGATRFDVKLWVDATCRLALAARDREDMIVDDDAPAPWLRSRVETDAAWIACAELGDHALHFVWPSSAAPRLRTEVMRALGAVAAGVWPAPVTNAAGTVAIAGKSLPLAPQTAGLWKVTTIGDATVLDALDADTPFAIVVSADAPCLPGAPLPVERAQGFAPPALWPVRRMAPPPAPATLLLASCLALPPHAPHFEIRALADAAEPPSGPAAVKVRAVLVAAASAFGVDPEVGHADVHDRAPRGGESPVPRAIAAHYRADTAVWGGMLSLSPPAGGADRGVLIGADVRASPKYGFGLAANLAGELGYTSGTEGEVRGGVGVGLGLGLVSVQVTAGAAGGSIGAAGAADLYVQGSALLELSSVIASAGALRTFATSGADQTRYDFRLALAPGGSRGTFVAGAQVIRFDGAGTAFVVYAGLGFTSAHEAPDPTE